MARYHLTNLAVKDLADIWNYTFDNWSEEQADYYYEQLVNGRKKIADNPNSGRNYNGITNDLFGLKVNRHIIFYRIVTLDKVEITRILHEMSMMLNPDIEQHQQGMIKGVVANRKFQQLLNT